MGFSWRTQLAIVAGVVLTVIVSLLLAQVDTLQRRSALPARTLPVVDVQATVAAAEWTIVQLLASGGSPTAVAAAATGEPDTAVESATPAATVACAGIPTDWQPYVVVVGDTLSGLATRHETTVQLLQIVNCLAGDELTPGAIVYVPSQQPLTDIDLTGCRPPASWRPVRVRPGATLSSLALQYRTTVYEIMRANCLESTTIYADRTLYLPPLAFPTAVPPTSPPFFTPTPLASATPTGIPSPTATISATLAPVSPTPDATLPPTATATAPGTAVTPSATAVSPTPGTPTTTATPNPPTAAPSATPTPGEPTPSATPIPPTAEPSATPAAPTPSPPPPSPTSAVPTATTAPPSQTAVPPTAAGRRSDHPAPF